MTIPRSRVRIGLLLGWMVKVRVDHRFGHSSSDRLAGDGLHEVVAIQGKQLDLRRSRH